MNGYVNTNNHHNNKSSNKNKTSKAVQTGFDIDNLYYEGENIERIDIDIDSTFHYDISCADIECPTYYYLKSSNKSNKSNSTYFPLPSYPTTYGPIHLYTEYAYELLIGSRLLTEGQLEPCEFSITNYTIIYHKALDYYNNASTYYEREEGIFEIFDTFMVFTPLTIACYTSGTYMSETVTSDVYANIEQPISILYNVMYELFKIFNAVAAEISNSFYGDYFSFSFWLGDLIYRIFVVRHLGVDIVFT